MLAIREVILDEKLNEVAYVVKWHDAGVWGRRVYQRDTESA